MLTWEVLKSNGERENVTAESVFINNASTLLFLKKAAVETPAIADDAEPAKKSPFKKKAWKPKAQTITVRAFNVHRWDDVRLLD